jgi:hypothetical protein
MTERKRNTLSGLQRLAKLEADATYAERKADEWGRKAAEIRERIATKKREAAEIAGVSL